MRGRVRRLLSLVLAACCLSAWLPHPRPALAHGRGRVNRALLVGVDDFVSQPSVYPAATNNVFAMQEALQASSVPFAAIMIPAAPVTDVPALTALIRDTFAQADEDDANYLYLCTHGEYSGKADEQPCLLLSDGATEDRLTPALLEAAFEGVRGVKVLLLDACYSGAFIGKGMRGQPRELYFLGKDFKVLTSSGAMENSWYWSTAQTGAAGADSFPQGAFYFTQALSQSLSPRWGFSADLNRDGEVTLRELYTSLMDKHAASTPQVYPQEDDYPVFFCDQDAVTADNRAPIGDVTFADAQPIPDGAALALEYIALRPVRVAYQVVRQQEGAWRFDQAQLLYDNVEQYTAFGDERGAVTAGRKVRTLDLTLAEGCQCGYVLVQLLSIEGQKLAVHAGTVVAVPPTEGDLQLSVEAPASYAVGGPGELAVFVRHAFPCRLSLSVVNSAGETVRRLCHRQSTRPLGITPEGSTFYWNGCDKRGNPLPPGEYRLVATGYLGERAFTAESGPLTLTAAGNP